MFHSFSIRASIRPLCAAAAILSVAVGSAAAGDVWHITPTGAPAGLRGVAAVSRNVVWASGTGGTVLRTVDGGITWDVIRVPGAETIDFRDIQAFDADRACLLNAGRPARFFRTEDGGRTWTETYRNDSEGIFFDCFSFFDADHGIAVGDSIGGRFMIARTSDGGRTWTEAPASERPEAKPGEGPFAASGTSLTIFGTDGVMFCTGGPEAKVMISRDRGRTWKAGPSPLGLGTSTSGGFSLAFLDENKGVMVGGDYKDETGARKNAALTFDGGLTWTPVATDQPAGFRECVAFVPAAPDVLVTVGPSGSDISTDGGRTWKPLPAPRGFHGLSFSPDGAGWAVGNKGLVARLDLEAAKAVLEN